MPLIDEYKIKKVISFKKKSYRPWDIEIDENSSSNSDSDLSTTYSMDQGQETREKIQKEKISTNSLKNLNKIEKQLDNKQVTDKVTIKEQLDNKQVTIKEQLDNKQVTIREQTGNELGNELGNKQVTIKKQKKDVEKPLLDSVHRLCGLQRKILFYIVNQCIIRGQLNTGPITNEALRDIEKSDVATIKTSLHRLAEKGWISREKGKTGRGGFVSFKVTEITRNKVLEELKNLVISKQLDNKQVTNKVTEPLCSSSYIYNTTTNTAASFKFPNEWKDIDIQPLESIKFTQAHLEQIFKFGKLEARMVQDSIYAFAFDIQHNDKSKELKLSPLNVFMGIMKKGNIYLPPDNYETSEEISLKKYIEIKKQRENKRKEQEKEAYNLSYKEWLETSDPNYLDSLVDIKYRGDKEDMIYKSCIKHYFEQKLWPDLKSNIFIKKKPQDI